MFRSSQSNMEPDVYINNIDPEQIENDLTRHIDTLSPSWTGDGQEIPVVVVTPQDTLNTDIREGSIRLAGNDAKKVYLEVDLDDKVGDVIKRETEDISGNDIEGQEDDEDNSDADLQKFRQGTKRKRRLTSSGDDGPEARMRSREEVILDKIKLQKELMGKIRFQPWHIEKKLKMLRKAKKFLKGHQDKLSKSQDYHQKSIQAFRRLNRELINVVSLFVPWEMRIKKVESHFGSVVASYFLFLRWILGVNGLLTLLTVAFIIVPQMTVGHANHWQMIPNTEKPKSKDLETLFNAQGFIKYSPFFYGYYDSTMIGHGYMMPLAYLGTGLVVYGLSIIIVLRKMAANVRLNKMASKDEQFSFSWKVFNSWDYMVGHAETANNKYAAITTSFKESIREVEEKQKVEKKNLLIFLRTIGCILTFALLSASGYLTYLVVMASNKNTDPNQNFFELNQTTWVITAIFIVFPNLFDLISTMEQYHPRTNLRVQLARVFILNFLNVVTLMYSLYEKINGHQCPSSSENTTAGTKSSDNGSDSKGRLTSTQSASIWTPELFNSSASGVTLTTPAVSVTDCKPFKCWETYVGQEVFKITVLDLLMTIIMIFLQDFFRGLFVRFCNCCWCWNLEKTFPEYSEFKTAENILHLINNQGMIWLGWFFSPGISVMNLVKLIVLAYVRFWSVLVCNVPEKRIFRASRSNNFYYALLLIMLFMCCIPSMIVFFNKYSRDCGPFRDINDIMDLFVKNSPFVAEILKFASKPATSLVLLGSFSLVIYYLWSTSQSMKEVNRDLKKTLEYERTEGKKKVYAIADAKRARDAAAESARASASATNAEDKVERKSVSNEVRTTKEGPDVSKKPKPKSTFHLSEERDGGHHLINKETKPKQITRKTPIYSKQLTLRSAKKESERLQRDTRLGEIKLAKLKKFQLDREIKDVEKRILIWTEESQKSEHTETSFHTLLEPESQRDNPREQRVSDLVLDLPKTHKLKNNGNGKDQKQNRVRKQTSQTSDVPAHCSHELHELRRSKTFARREPHSSNVIPEESEEQDEEETRVIARKYPVDVNLEPRHMRQGYDNIAFVESPERKTKYFSEDSVHCRQQVTTHERRRTGSDSSENSAVSYDDILKVPNSKTNRQRRSRDKSPNRRQQVTTDKSRTMNFPENSVSQDDMLNVSETKKYRQRCCKSPNHGRKFIVDESGTMDDSPENSAVLYDDMLTVPESSKGRQRHLRATSPDSRQQATSRKKIFDSPDDSGGSYNDLLNIPERGRNPHRRVRDKSPDRRHQVTPGGRKVTNPDCYNKDSFRDQNEEEDSSDEEYVEIRPSRHHRHQEMPKTTKKNLTKTSALTCPPRELDPDRAIRRSNLADEALPSDGKDFINLSR